MSIKVRTSAFVRLIHLWLTTRPHKEHFHPRRGQGRSFIRKAMWTALGFGLKRGRAFGPLAAFHGWEKLANRLWPKREIPGAPYGLLTFCVRHHGGEAIRLSDGTLVEKGSLVIELHCNNMRILNLVTEGQKNPFAACRQDLDALAVWLEENDKCETIRAVCGYTILTKGALRLGFEVRPSRPTVWQRFQKLYMTGLLVLYSREGVSRAFYGSTPLTLPCYVWMSRYELLRRYGRTRGEVSEVKALSRKRPSSSVSSDSLMGGSSQASETYQLKTRVRSWNKVFRGDLRGRSVAKRRDQAGDADSARRRKLRPRRILMVGLIVVYIGWYVLRWHRVLWP